MTGSTQSQPCFEVTGHAWTYHSWAIIMVGWLLGVYLHIRHLTYLAIRLWAEGDAPSRSVGNCKGNSIELLDFVSTAISHCIPSSRYYRSGLNMHYQVTHAYERI